MSEAQELSVGATATATGAGRAIAITQHRTRVMERWAALNSTAGQKALQARVASIQVASDDQTYARFVQAAVRAKTSRQRVMWLHRAADVVSHAAESTGSVACRQGCAHCCHIPITITRPEALYISSMTSRPIVQSPVGVIDTADVNDNRHVGVAAEDGPWRHHIGVPCPFLVNNQCSIYKARPLACRYHFSLDTDSLLCELSQDGQSIDQPTLNTLARQVNAQAVLGIAHDVADIRDWFACPEPPPVPKT